MPAATRERIVTMAGELFRRRGYTGTGLKQIALESGAPIGSMYHFFPGGKDELTAEALRVTGRGYQLLVESVFDNEPDLLDGIRACFTTAAEVLVATDYADACPIETVALEVASTNERLRVVTAEVFEQWIDSATTRLHVGGVPHELARPLAMALIAGLEGAFVLSRAMKDPQPLHAAGDAAIAAVEAALADQHESAEEGHRSGARPLSRRRGGG